MAKENKKSLIIWAAVALVIGVIIGLLITNITTTGKAKAALQEAKVRNTQNYGVGYDFFLSQTYVGDNIYGEYQLYSNEYIVSSHPGKVDLQRSVGCINCDNYSGFDNSTYKVNTIMDSTLFPGRPYKIESSDFYYFKTEQSAPILSLNRQYAWFFDNGDTTSYSWYFNINENANEFVRLNSFRGNCSGYKLSYQDSAHLPISQISYRVQIFDTQASSGYWELVSEESYYDSIENGMINSNGIQEKFFSTTTQQLLNNSNERYFVSIDAIVQYEGHFPSRFGTYYYAQCSNGMNDPKYANIEKINELKKSSIIPSDKDTIKEFKEKGMISTTKTITK